MYRFFSSQKASYYRNLLLDPSYANIKPDLFVFSFSPFYFWDQKKFILISDPFGHTSLIKLIIVRCLGIYGDIKLAGTSGQLGHVFVSLSLDPWDALSTQPFSFRIVLLLHSFLRNHSLWLPHFHMIAVYEEQIIIKNNKNFKMPFYGSSHFMKSKHFYWTRFFLFCYALQGSKKKIGCRENLRLFLFYICIFMCANNI